MAVSALKWEFQLSRFHYNFHDERVFYSSHWKLPRPLFLAVRILMAVYALYALTHYVVYFTAVKTPKQTIFVFFTTWSLIVLTAHLTWAAVLAAIFYRRVNYERPFIFNITHSVSFSNKRYSGPENGGTAAGISSSSPSSDDGQKNDHQHAPHHHHLHDPHHTPDSKSDTAVMLDSSAEKLHTNLANGDSKTAAGAAAAAAGVDDNRSSLGAIDDSSPEANDSSCLGTDNSSLHGADNSSRHGEDNSSCLGADNSFRPLTNIPSSGADNNFRFSSPAAHDQIQIGSFGSESGFISKSKGEFESTAKSNGNNNNNNNKSNNNNINNKSSCNDDTQQRPATYESFFGDPSCEQLQRTAPIPWYFRVSWGLSDVILCAAPVVTIIYFSAIYPRLKNRTHVSVQDFNVHILNLVLTVVDFALAARPVRIFHVWAPLAYGISWVVFSVVYWSTDRANHVIYKFIDWSRPGPTLAWTGGLSLAFVLLMVVFFALYRFKLWLYTAVHKEEFYVVVDDHGMD